MADEKKPKADAPKKEREAQPETPSAIANAELGDPDKLSGEDLAAVADRWNAAKRRAHRGF